MRHPSAAPRKVRGSNTNASNGAAPTTTGTAPRTLLLYIGLTVTAALVLHIVSAYLVSGASTRAPSYNTAVQRRIAAKAVPWRELVARQRNVDSALEEAEQGPREKRRSSPESNKDADEFIAAEDDAKADSDASVNAAVGNANHKAPDDGVAGVDDSSVMNANGAGGLIAAGGSIDELPLDVDAVNLPPGVVGGGAVAVDPGVGAAPPLAPHHSGKLRDRLSFISMRRLRHARTADDEGWGADTETAKGRVPTVSGEEASFCGQYAKQDEVLPRGHAESPKVHVNVHALPPRHSERGRRVGGAGARGSGSGLAAALQHMSSSNNDIFTRLPLRALMFACIAESDVCQEIEQLQGAPAREATSANALLVAAERFAVLDHDSNPNAESRTTVIDFGAGSGLVALSAWQHADIAKVVAADIFPPSTRLLRLAHCLSVATDDGGTFSPADAKDRLAHDDSLVTLNVVPTSQKAAGASEHGHHDDADCAVRSTAPLAGSTKLLPELDLARAYCPAETPDDRKHFQAPPASGELVFDVPSALVADVVRSHYTDPAIAASSSGDAGAKAVTTNLILRLDTHGHLATTALLRASMAAFAAENPHRPDLLAVEIYPPRDLAGSGGAFDHAANEGKADAAAGGGDRHAAASREDDDEDEESLGFVDLLVGHGYVGYAHHLQTFFLKAESELSFAGDAHRFLEWREVSLRVNLRPKFASEVLTFTPKKPAFVFPGRSECVWDPHAVMRERYPDAPVPALEAVENGATPAVQVVSMGAFSTPIACPAAWDAHCEALMLDGDEAPAASLVADVDHALRKLFAEVNQARDDGEKKGSAATAVRLVDIGGPLSVTAVMGGKLNARLTSVQSSPRATHLARITMCLNEVAVSDTARIGDPEVLPPTTAIQAVLAGTAGTACEVHQSLKHASKTRLVCHGTGASPAASSRRKNSHAVAWTGAATTLDELLLTSAWTAQEDLNNVEAVVLVLHSGFTADVFDGAQTLLSHPTRKPRLIITVAAGASDAMRFGERLFAAGYTAFVRRSGVFLTGPSEFRSFLSADAAMGEFEIQWAADADNALLKSPAGSRRCLRPTAELPSVRTASLRAGSLSARLAEAPLTLVACADSVASVASGGAASETTCHAVSEAVRGRGLSNGQSELELAFEHALRVFSGLTQDPIAHEAARAAKDSRYAAAAAGDAEGAASLQKQLSAETRASEIRRVPLVLYVGESSGRIGAATIQHGGHRIAYVSASNASRQLQRFSACLNGLQEVPLLTSWAETDADTLAQARSAPWVTVAMDTWQRPGSAAGAAADPAQPRHGGSLGALLAKSTKAASPQPPAQDDTRVAGGDDEAEAEQELAWRAVAGPVADLRESLESTTLDQVAATLWPAGLRRSGKTSGVVRRHDDDEAAIKRRVGDLRSEDGELVLFIAAAPALPHLRGALGILAPSKQQRPQQQGGTGPPSVGPRGKFVRRPLTLFTMVTRIGDDLAESAALLLRLGYRGYCAQQGLHIHTMQQAQALQRGMPSNTTGIQWYDSPPSGIDGARLLPPNAAPQCAVPLPGVLDSFFTPILRAGVRVACPSTSGMNGAQCLPVDTRVAESVRVALLVAQSIEAGNSADSNNSPQKRLTHRALHLPREHELKLLPFAEIPLVKRSVWFVDLYPRDGFSGALDAHEQGATVIAIDEIPAHVTSARLGRCLLGPSGHHPHSHHAGAEVSDAGESPTILFASDAASARSRALGYSVIKQHLVAAGDAEGQPPCVALAKAADEHASRHPWQQQPRYLDCTVTASAAAAAKNHEGKSTDAASVAYADSVVTVPQGTLDGALRPLAEQAMRHRTSVGLSAPFGGAGFDVVLRLRLNDDAKRVVEGASALLGGKFRGLLQPPRLIVADVSCKARRIAKVLRPLMDNGLIAVTEEPHLAVMLSAADAAAACAARVDAAAAGRKKELSGGSDAERDEGRRAREAAERSVHWKFVRPSDVDMLFGSAVAGTVRGRVAAACTRCCGGTRDACATRFSPPFWAHCGCTGDVARTAAEGGGKLAEAQQATATTAEVTNAKGQLVREAQQVVVHVIAEAATPAPPTPQPTPEPTAVAEAETETSADPQR